eukprot:TRINITY_DN9930_c0_g1_i5.p1 TRINITY_DN9930_c0_g1~~TRINITY_DN9930_c0_g1_i5.p1  ORF type:complete len:1273 (-),score=291.41 TRINITY_DN9930_c0_g1_i5:204-4022(-)
MANEDYLSLEGGEGLVEYIIFNSSITDEYIKKWSENQKKTGVNDPAAVSPSELRGMCDYILSLMTTTIPAMVDVLWPYLLEPLTKPKFNSSMAVVSKCISQISKVKRTSNAPNYFINFDDKVNLPKPQEIIARLFVLANLTNRRGNLALHLLSTLQYLGPVLHKNVVNLWDSTIPKLLGFLNGESFSNDPNDSKWEALVRRLFSETLKAIKDDSWSQEIGTAIINQFPLHVGDPEAKKLSLKLLGVVLQNLTHKDFVKATLKAMFDSTDHSNEEERIGCAQGFGYAASSHLDFVLEEQTSRVKVPEVKKESGGFWSIFASEPKAKQPSGGSQLTTTLAYGYITAYSKPNLITSRLDMHIINNILPNLDTNNLALQQTIVKVFDLIGQTLHVDHLGAEYRFKHRDDFLRHLMRYINLNPSPPSKENKQVPLESVSKRLTLQAFACSVEKIKLSILGLNACSTLAKLDSLPRDLEEDIVAIACQYFTLEKEVPKPKDEKKDQTPTGEDKQQENVDISLVFENVDRMLMVCLGQDTSIACLSRVVQVIIKFFFSPEMEHRKRASASYVRLLKKYVELMSERISQGTRLSDRHIEGLGYFLGTLLPRCCDPCAEIRGNSIESIQLLLYINMTLEKVVKEQSEGKGPGEIDLKAPKTLAPFTGLKKRMIQSEDQNEQFSLAHSMASILAKLVSKIEFPTLINTAIDGLLDTQVTGARGNCVILFGLVSERGSDLGDSTTRTVTKLIQKMKDIKNEQTMNGTLHALRTIAKIHLDAAIDSLVEQPVPHEEHMRKVLGVFVTDSDLIKPSIKALTDLINNGDIVEELELSKGQTKNDDKAKKAEKKASMVPTKESQAATLCLAEMLTHEEMEDIILQQGYFSLFFGSFILRVGMTAGFEGPASHCVLCWRNLFTIIQEEDVLEKLTETGTLEHIKTEENMVTGITALTSIMARRHVAEMDKVFTFLVPFLKANFNGQRTVACFVLAELINHAGTNDVLLEKLVTNLLSSLVDPLLKIPTLRGLGNISQCSQQMVDKYSPSVLDALMSSIDDKLNDVVLETMNCLAKVFKVVDESRIAPILINIFHRIRPAFDNSNNNIRTAAARLFASLARFGEGQSREKIYEQVHSNLPCLILHVNDVDDGVKKAFREALYAVGPLLHHEPLITLLNTKHVFNVDSETDYNDLIRMHLSKALISGFPRHLNTYIQTCINPYFDSEWDQLKGNAAYLIGCILFHLPQEMRREVGINPAHIAKAIIGLLSSESGLVRLRAADSISMLHSY